MKIIIEIDASKIDSNGIEGYIRHCLQMLRIIKIEIENERKKNM